MYTGKTGESTKGEWGESKVTTANFLNKGSFRYTGFHYNFLLVDYETFCQHSSTGDVDEECDMGGGGGDCLFLMGERGLVEFDGQLLSAAPVVYDDPPPLHKRVFRRPPFVSQIVILTGLICPWAGNLVANF